MKQLNPTTPSDLWEPIAKVVLATEYAFESILSRLTIFKSAFSYASRQNLHSRSLAPLPLSKRQEYHRNWLRRGESNSWSLDYRSSALNQLSYSAMEPKSGIEPLTYCVPGSCSFNGAISALEMVRTAGPEPAMNWV
jgi:hypothetical protein